MYCPHCLSGYPVGVSACARCGASLVAELPPHQGTENREELVTVLVIEDSFGLKLATAALDEAGITVNKNTIPFETRSPFQASGIRLGTPAVTTRGMKEIEMAAIADMISEVLLDIKNLDTLHQVRQRVRELTARFPLPY